MFCNDVSAQSFQITLFGSLFGIFELELEVEGQRSKTGGWQRGGLRTYTERLRSSLMALISIFLRPILLLCQGKGVYVDEKVGF